jgi:hypothetical protein
MVLMGVLGRRIDDVDVEVDGRFEHPQPFDAGLLASLSQGNPGKVTVTVCMATGLEPALQLCMEQEQDPAIRRIDHESGPGEVSGSTGAEQGTLMLVEEFEDPVPLGPGGAV